MRSLGSLKAQTLDSLLLLHSLDSQLSICIKPQFKHLLFVEVIRGHLRSLKLDLILFQEILTLIRRAVKKFEDLNQKLKQGPSSNRTSPSPFIFFKNKIFISFKTRLKKYLLQSRAFQPVSNHYILNCIIQSVPYHIGLYSDCIILDYLQALTPKYTHNTRNTQYFICMPIFTLYNFL